MWLWADTDFNILTTLFSHLMSHSNHSWHLKSICLKRDTVLVENSQYWNSYLPLFLVSEILLSPVFFTFVFHHMNYISKIFLERIAMVLCINHQFSKLNEFPLLFFVFFFRRERLESVYANPLQPSCALHRENWRVVAMFLFFITILFSLSP